MITTNIPTSWQDLQVQTARILQQCGFNVEIEKKMDTVRGNVEIDVFAEEEIKGRRYSILCECKYWKSNVPQHVIHGFRTVINDLGCNIGYIISTSDFQSGAIAASALTNIKLLTWIEFQNEFLESWYDNYFVPTLTSNLDPLFTYCEPLLPKWFNEMSEKDKELFSDLKEKWDIFGIIMMSFSSYTRMFRKKDLESLPLRARLKITEDIELLFPEGILDDSSYNNFLDKAIFIGSQAISEFRVFSDKYSKGQSDE